MSTNDLALDERIQQSLRAAHDSLLKRGDLLTKDRLSECFKIFRERFGPERLKTMDGEVLLNTMHAHGSRDSLVYWLEYKNDDEFPGPVFGSIAGGSALKFGLYYSRETGEWMTGTSRNQTPIPVSDAIAKARSHRDQLTAAVAELDALPVGSDDKRYLALQEKLDVVAPDVARLAWGHKYLSLLFPDKLDDFHNIDWHRHNLIRLLQAPPTQEGLYVSAGTFVRLANQFGWPMNHLTAALNERNGPPIKYWRVGTRLGEGNDAQDIWPDMKAAGFAAIGWPGVGDLSNVVARSDGRVVIAKLLAETSHYNPSLASRKAGEIRNFSVVMEENDIVLAADGETILGVGVVKGPYRFENTPPHNVPHRRPVEWHSGEKWKLPTSEGLRTTFVRLNKDDRNLIEAERHLLMEPRVDVTPSVQPPSSEAPQIRKIVRLEGHIPGKLQAILERKGQAILYGPPGTGKTHWGTRVARDLAAINAFGHLHNELSEEQKESVQGSGSKSGLVRCCTFHPAFGYEDFIEGYRPRQGAGGQLVFEMRDGIFKRLCRDAAAAMDKKFILLIDEINRGDIPRIFGELLTLLEINKRGQKVVLPLSGEEFFVPANVMVIATMNTADRSIALLDTALRRRFGFVELMPDSSTLAGASVGGVIPLSPWLDALNGRVREHVGKDARNLQIGHAYLMDENGNAVTDFARFARILSEDIIPLLEEYCYEDYGALVEILGKTIVDGDRQRIRDELFLPARRQDLIQALLAPTPQLTTTLEAVSQTTPEPELEDDSEDPAK